jgi:hypothetical protein
MKYLNIIFFFLVFWSCSKSREENIILNVNAIVNKSPSETGLIIGMPDSTYTLRILGKPIFCQMYSRHNIEIQYPENLATDIVVYGPHKLPFNQTALSAFKIDYKTHHPGEYIKNQLIRWFDVEEFSTISFYNPKFDSAGNISNFTIFFKAKSNGSSVRTK